MLSAPPSGLWGPLRLCKSLCRKNQEAAVKDRAGVNYELNFSQDIIKEVVKKWLNRFTGMPGIVNKYIFFLCVNKCILRSSPK